MRVTVDLDSAYGPHRDETLGVLEIVNDGTGDASTGNYLVTLYGKKGRLMAVSTIKGWPRLRRHAWDLVAEALLRLRPHVLEGVEP